MQRPVPFIVNLSVFADKPVALHSNHPFWKGKLVLVALDGIVKVRRTNLQVNLALAKQDRLNLGHSGSLQATVELPHQLGEFGFLGWTDFENHAFHLVLL